MAGLRLHRESLALGSLTVTFVNVQVKQPSTTSYTPAPVELHYYPPLWSWRNPFTKCVNNVVFVGNSQDGRIGPALHIHIQHRISANV